MDIRFDGRVAIVTGAGNGLGRAHALALAERGAKVVVNDFGGSGQGAGRSCDVAESVAEEIRSGGGEAIADPADVSQEEEVKDMVAKAMDRWGRVDILVNNAGITRDKSFGKMDIADFRKVVDVHLLGTTLCTHAVWNIMRDQNYGRVLMTSSTSGLYGAFAQAAYAAAKSGMLGLMNVLHIEGAKHGIRVNMLAPWAATRLTAGLLPQEALDLMGPESVTPGVLFLVSEDAPARIIMSAGSGCFARIRLLESDAVFFPPDGRTPEAIAERFAEISAIEGQREVTDTFDQNSYLVRKAAAGLGIASPL
ncbi:SDR family NAD(P)-dependent oxidoreductase [Arvimicrobium flavum]|uniref:SDR family NAD(P)-dependent oxidoreductase n=1 Tax=Arvimicrobium flavum TaxID=3393320 RepID=UPI00237AD0A6|nr:SDR family NAD(P)-dependent oxidoreductase [Mesorhizobium shangrilense]